MTNKFPTEKDEMTNEEWKEYQESLYMGSCSEIQNAIVDDYDDMYDEPISYATHGAKFIKKKTQEFMKKFHNKIWNTKTWKWEEKND